MLMITGTDEGGQKRILTVGHDSTGRATLRVYKHKDHMDRAGLPVGELLGSIKLTCADLTELKRSL